MSSYKSEKLPKWLMKPIAIFVILFVIYIVIGLLFIDPKQFFGNLFAGFAGVFLGFIITLSYLDGLVEHYRKQQWAKTRDYTFTDLASHLRNFVYEITYSFADIGLSPNAVPPPNSHQGVVIYCQTLANELRKIQDYKGEKTPSDITVEFYEFVKWDLDQIQLVLTPRVIQSQAEQELIDVLIEFDQARRDLHNGVTVDKLISTQAAFPPLISLVEMSGKVYETLGKYWEVDYLRDYSQPETNQ
jgi:hypothetical protein